MSRQDDGRWILELEDASVALILDAERIRAINNDYLDQQLGVPFEDAGECSSRRAAAPIFWT